MASEIRASVEAAVAIPEIYAAEAHHARYAVQRVVPRVQNLTTHVTKKGDTINLRFFPRPAVNPVGAGGSVSNQALTLTQVQVLVDQWIEMTVDIEDKADVQADIDLFAGFSKAFGMQFGETLDSFLLGKFADFTTTDISDGTDNLSEDDVLAAVVTLDEAKESPENRTWFFHPRVKKSLLKLEHYTTAEKTGNAKGVAITGEWGELYGSPVIVTPLVNQVTTVLHNLYVHKDAMGIAIQRNLNIERLARTKKSTPLSADALYGGKVIRPTGGVDLLSLASA